MKQIKNTKYLSRLNLIPYVLINWVKAYYYINIKFKLLLRLQILLSHIRMHYIFLYQYDIFHYINRLYFFCIDMLYFYYINMLYSYYINMLHFYCINMLYFFFINYIDLLY